MRALFAAAMMVTALGVAGTTPAAAADLVEPGPTHGVRAGEVLLYDFQPGVITRAWWLAPWRHRHYFPTHGKHPVLGRLEDLSARRKVQPAKTFYRSWSNVALFVPPPPPVLDREGVPRHPRAPVQP
jgi:hypothetical protein